MQMQVSTACPLAHERESRFPKGSGEASASHSDGIALIRQCSSTSMPLSCMSRAGARVEAWKPGKTDTCVNGTPKGRKEQEHAKPSAASIVRVMQEQHRRAEAGQERCDGRQGGWTGDTIR